MTVEYRRLTDCHMTDGTFVSWLAVDGDNIECIYYKDAVLSYPMHTHAKHVTFGHVLDGGVRIICNGEKYLYHAGENFCILPDTPHAVEAVKDTPYSMIIICVSVDEMSDEGRNEISCIKKLKQLILDTPENVLLIEDMAQSIGMSPYHMIRKFKDTCGLTSHQFQIQCRIRKAQKLLEDEKSVTEVAYATGFCDQSHFDRCFRKMVRMTPSEYKQSVKRLA